MRGEETLQSIPSCDSDIRIRNKHFNLGWTLYGQDKDIDPSVFFLSPSVSSISLLFPPISHSLHRHLEIFMYDIDSHRFSLFLSQAGSFSAGSWAGLFLSYGHGQKKQSETVHKLSLEACRMHVIVDFWSTRLRQLPLIPTLSTDLRAFSRFHPHTKVTLLFDLPVFPVSIWLVREHKALGLGKSWEKNPADSPVPRPRLNLVLPSIHLMANSKDQILRRLGISEGAYSQIRVSISLSLFFSASRSKPTCFLGSRWRLQ